MISNSYQSNSYAAPACRNFLSGTITSTSITYSSVSSRHNMIYDERSRIMSQRFEENLVKSSSFINSYSSTSSCPNGFFDNFPQQKQSISDESCSDSFSEEDYSEDTESLMDSGDSSESDLSSEIKSRNEADEELANIFGSDETQTNSSCDARASCFLRPLNPMVNDRQFVLPRCSAPSIERQPMASNFTKYNSEAITLRTPFSQLE